MNDASLYAKNNNVQQLHTKYVLEKYLPLLNWNTNENIIDVGSGDGATLLNILLPKLPPHLKKIVASDICEDMILFMEKKFENYPNIEIIYLNIAANLIPSEPIGRFGHVFSSYCIHWVVDQRQALQNVYDLLMPKGETFIIQVANHAMYDIYESMSSSEKWSRFSFKNFTPVYQHSTDAARDMNNVLKSVGFHSYMCEVMEMSYSYNSWDDFWIWSTSINPYLKYVSPLELDDYRKDYLQEAKKHKSVKTTFDSGDPQIVVNYKLLVVFATKSM